VNVTQKIQNDPVIQLPGNLWNVTWTDAFTGVDTQGWSDGMRMGWNMTSPASGYKYIYDLGNGKAHNDYDNAQNPKYRDWQEANGALINPSTRLPLAVPGIPTSLESEVKIEFAQRVRSARRAFQGGTFLGELAESIRMIRRPAQALRQSIADFPKDVKKRSRGRHDKLKVASATYLEYKFGWDPLARDVGDAIKAAARKPPFYSIPVSVSRSRELTVEDTSHTRFYSPRLRYDFDLRRTGAVDLRYKGAVKYHAPSRASEWRDTWGLGTSDFVPTVYNLLPYSFLVDYFSNIGDVIDSMSLGTLGLHWGCRTARMRSTVTLRRITHNPEGANSSGYAYLSGFKLENNAFTRSNLGNVSVGISDINIKIPGVSSNKWLNIGALVGSRRRNR
jgi:hypothetical protein